MFENQVWLHSTFEASLHYPRAEQSDSKRDRKSETEGEEVRARDGAGGGEGGRERE